MFTLKWLTIIFTHIFLPTGQRIRDVDLTATPRVVTRDLLMPLSEIDAGLCSSEGIKLFKGSQYYQYESVMTLTSSKIAPLAHDITSAMMGCQD